MNPYTTIPAPNQEGADTTFTNDDWVTRGRPPRIILSEGWTSIGVAAFNGATELQTIRIPASVVSIQHLAFGDTINLREVEFVEGSHLDTIDEVAFFRTTALERINIPARVTRIGPAAFVFSGLQEVTFENGSRLETIEYQVFAMNTALQRINIPASVREIADQAFYNTSSLVEVSFEQNSQITTIHPIAFIDSGLIRVAIGETALNRLNNNPSPLHFGPNNDFYGREDVTIVSRSQQFNIFAMLAKRAGPPPPPNSGLERRRPIPKSVADYTASFIIKNVEPKSGNTQSPAEFAAAAAAAAEARKGGARKSRRRKRGIRRRSRKASRARKTKKRK